MYSRTFKTLHDVFRKAREELSTYRDQLEISDRIKKGELKKEFSKPTKDFSTAISNFKKESKSTFPTRKASPGGFKKLGSLSPRVDYLKDIKCYKYHKKVHYANKCPESKDKR